MPTLHDLTRRTWIRILIAVAVVAVAVYMVVEWDVDEPPPLADATLILTVVNRSTDEDPARIRVTLDGELVVNDDFAAAEGSADSGTGDSGTGGSGTGEFTLPVEEGEHLLVATSNSGVIHEFAVDLPAGTRKWVLLEFRYAPDDPRHFTVTENDEPIAADQRQG